MRLFILRKIATFLRFIFCVCCNKFHSNKKPKKQQKNFKKKDLPEQLENEEKQREIEFDNQMTQLTEKANQSLQTEINKTKKEKDVLAREIKVFICFFFICVFPFVFLKILFSSN